MTQRSGFTLIELLVVISIIAVLSVIGLVAYSNFMKSSRNAKRESDLRIIQSALEDFHSDQIYYPFSITFGSSLTDGSKTYLNNIPKDQLGNPEYKYAASGTNCSETAPQNCTKYCVYAALENVTTSSLSGCAQQSGYNFALTSP